MDEGEQPGKLVLSPEEERRLDEYARSPCLPPEIQRSVEAYISGKVGKPWTTPVILDRLRSAIRELKAAYWREGDTRRIGYRTGYRVFAYLAYHFPVCYAQFRCLLTELAKEGLLQRRMTVLDAGTGPGAVPLAIRDFFRLLGRGEARIFSVEREREHLEAFGAIALHGVSDDAVKVMPPIEGDVMQPPVQHLPPRFDLIVFSNVLNELPLRDAEARAQLVREYAPLLADDGTIVLIEPADLGNSTLLRNVARKATEDGMLNIYAPCSFPWKRRCRLERCWSFLSLPPMRKTAMMEALGQAPDGYRYVNTDLKFTYALLRRDGRTKQVFEVRRGAKYAPFSSLMRHVGRRINVIGAVMSGDLGDTENHVFRLCDGTSTRPVFAVVPRHHLSAGNRPLFHAKYGELFLFHGVIVRYNREQDAFNLLVQRGSLVRPVAGREDLKTMTGNEDDTEN